YLIRNLCQHNCFICCFDKIFHIPFWRKSFIFGESILIPLYLLDMSCRILSTILVKFISTKCSTKQMNVSLQTTKS
ncbi:hypothetical protein C0J52_20766, partial [Blattella germanica]